MGWTEVWQYSKLVKCPLENRYFASYIVIAAVYFERICISMSPEHISVIPNLSQIKFGPIRILKNGLHFGTYKCVQNKTLRSQSMKQNADFQEGV